METKGLSGTLSCTAEVSLQDQAQGVILTVVATGQAVLLNYTAHQVLADLHRGTTRSALIDRLVAEFGMDPDRARIDVDECLRTLLDAGLLESR